MTVLAFTVPGAAVSKKRPRVTARGTFTDKRTIGYEALVRMHALKARQEFKRIGVGWSLDAAYSAQLMIYLPTRRRIDGDNIEKSALDACNGVLWNDDSQVWRCEWTRYLACENPRLVVIVHSMGEA